MSCHLQMVPDIVNRKKQSVHPDAVGYWETEYLQLNKMESG